MGRTSEKCPCCERQVRATQTDTISIPPIMFKGYKIIAMRVQTRKCSCGAIGRTPVFIGKTDWEVPKNLQLNTYAHN